MGQKMACFSLLGGWVVETILPAAQALKHIINIRNIVGK